MKPRIVTLTIEIETERKRADIVSNARKRRIVGRILQVQTNVIQATKVGSKAAVRKAWAG